MITNKGDYMEFIQAAKLAKKGRKIRRKGWKGYWYLKNDKDNAFKQHWVIHTADGQEIVNNFTNETIDNCLAKDWEEV